MKFITIGVYGFSEAAFFKTLQQAGVDTFCDIRWRRGVRGAEYAFANSARLQNGSPNLASATSISATWLRHRRFRQRQAEADKAQRIAKRKRSALSEVFIAAYRQERLSAFDSRKFIEQLGPEARTAALFCVEREPAACHRSILAERLQKDLGAQCEVAHLMPNPDAAEGAGG